MADVLESDTTENGGGTVDLLHDLSNGYNVGRLIQQIAAMDTPVTPKIPLSAQSVQDFGKQSGRDLLHLGDLPQGDRFFSTLHGQEEQRPQRVITAFGYQHAKSSDLSRDGL
jgi:hypothetical protein